MKVGGFGDDIDHTTRLLHAIEKRGWPLEHLHALCRIALIIAADRHSHAIAQDRPIIVRAKATLDQRVLRSAEIITDDHAGNVFRHVFHGLRREIHQGLMRDDIGGLRLLQKGHGPFIAHTAIGSRVGSAFTAHGDQFLARLASARAGRLERSLSPGRCGYYRFRVYRRTAPGNDTARLRPPSLSQSVGRACEAERGHARGNKDGARGPNRSQYFSIANRSHSLIATQIVTRRNTESRFRELELLLIVTAHPSWTVLATLLPPD